MEYKVNSFRLASAKELDIVKTFECGQCFRWNADENGCYTGVVKSFPALVWEENGSVYIKSDAPKEFLVDYFDLDTDYEKVSKPFLDVPYLDECTKAGMGIRILNQDPWEALCSFIISQCNNIKRIKGIVERLCIQFGDTVSLDGIEYKTFPSSDILSKLNADDLSDIRAGYRAQYIINAAIQVSEGKIDLEELKSVPYKQAKDELLKIHGVGEKVANCVVLFGLHHMEAFPIDVWIKRALNEHFPKDFKPSSLGDYAGLAQQYIFYNMRLD